MILLLAFALTLLLAVLISGVAQRTVLSTAVLFLAVGFLVGRGGLGLVSIEPDNQLVSQLAQLALFSVLFTDGMKVGLNDLREAWRLSGRALLFGLPITIAGTALLARWIVGLGWAESFLIGAALGPTDPVFAAAIVGREEVPLRLRRLLNVESGLNDGLALPVVLLLLGLVRGQSVPETMILGDLALGIVLGVLVPWLILRLEQFVPFSAATPYEPLHAFALGLLILALSLTTGVNVFLAAYTAGMTLATLSTEIRDAFRLFGEQVARLLKLAALLVFGALVSTDVLLTGVGWRGYLFALLALIAVRPVALGLALYGSELEWHERLAAFWFGPKGFASMIYGLLILHSGAPQAGLMFHLVAIIVSVSIIAHSSTDVVMARWFRETDQQTPASTPKKQNEPVGPDV